MYYHTIRDYTINIVNYILIIQTNKGPKNRETLYTYNNNIKCQLVTSKFVLNRNINIINNCRN